MRRLAPDLAHPIGADRTLRPATVARDGRVQRSWSVNRRCCPATDRIMVGNGPRGPSTDRGVPSAPDLACHVDGGVPVIALTAWCRRLGVPHGARATRSPRAERRRSPARPVDHFRARWPSPAARSIPRAWRPPTMNERILVIDADPDVHAVVRDDLDARRLRGRVRPATARRAVLLGATRAPAVVVLEPPAAGHVRRGRAPRDAAPVAGADHRPELERGDRGPRPRARPRRRRLHDEAVPHARADRADRRRSCAAPPATRRSATSWSSTAAASRSTPAAARCASTAPCAT